jgi:hypothetical protein
MLPQPKTLRAPRLAIHLVITPVVLEQLTIKTTAVVTRMLNTLLLNARDSSITLSKARGSKSTMSAVMASTWTSRRNLSSPSFSRAEVLAMVTLDSSR